MSYIKYHVYVTLFLTDLPGSSSNFRHPLTPLSTNKLHCTPRSSTLVKSKSVFSDIIIIPTPPQQKKVEKKKCARVLTSAESRALLEEKEKKKKQQQEEKERKKKEREEKRNAKEQEKQLKAQEREAKKAERQKKAQEKAKEKAAKQKRSLPSNGSSRSLPKRQKDENESGVQSREISLNECAVCFGTYEDDIDDITGHVTTEWIQCTNELCAVWSHADCLDTSDGDYVCNICQAIFI